MVPLGDGGTEGGYFSPPSGIWWRGLGGGLFYHLPLSESGQWRWQLRLADPGYGPPGVEEEINPLPVPFASGVHAGWCLASSPPWPLQQ